LTNWFSDDFNSLTFFFGIPNIKNNQEKKTKKIKKISMSMERTKGGQKKKNK